ncbi:MAG: LOG family protein [Ignavibacteriota bacterium]
MKKLITVFGPDGLLPADPSYAAAVHLGSLLGAAGFAVVTGGYDGIAEAVSQGAASQQGTVIGVSAEVYFARGMESNKYLTKEIRVKSANDRVMELLDLADAYIACGISPATMVEVATAWEYILQGFMEPKPILLWGAEWEDIAEILFRQKAYSGKTHPVEFIKTPEDAIERLQNKFGKQEKLPELAIIT